MISLLRSTAFVAFLLGSTLVQAEVQFRTVALDGQIAVADGSLDFDLFISDGSLSTSADLVINNLGDVGFFGGLSNGSAGLFLSTPSGISEMARIGTQPVATVSGSQFAWFQNLGMTINDVGKVAFSGAFREPGQSDDFGGAWSYDVTQGAKLVARTGSGAAGVDDFRVLPHDLIWGSLMNRHGEIVYHVYDEGQTRFAVLDDLSGNQKRIVGEEELSSPFVRGYNDQGQSMIFGHPPGSSPFSDRSDWDPHRGVWLERDGLLTAVATTTNPGVFGENLILGAVGETPSFNGSGEVTSTAHFVNGTRGIFVGTSEDDVSLVVRTGAQPFPDDMRLTMTGFGDSVIASDGSIFFSGEFGTNDFAPTGRGLFRVSPNGEITVIARTDSGLAPGVNEPWRSFSDLSVNMQGQAIISASTGSIGNIRTGYFAFDGQELTKVVAAGDQIEVRPGETREIEFLGFIRPSNNEDGRSSQFNDRGQLAFGAQFTDHSGGLFVATVKGLSEACDFDGDGECEVPDADMLVTELARGDSHPLFDLSGNGQVNLDDLDSLRAQIARMRGFEEPMIPGDANLDGTVDAIDLNPLALRWRADDPAWSAGNFVPPFDRIDANDLNVIGSNWQRSNKAITAAVPEPGGIRWMLLGVLPIGFLRRTAYMS